MEVVDEKVLAAATLPPHVVQQLEMAARPGSPVASTDASVDTNEWEPIDMPEQSGKLKAQKYRKGE